MTTEEALKVIFDHSGAREQKKAAKRRKRTSLQRTFHVPSSPGALWQSIPASSSAAITRLA